MAASVATRFILRVCIVAMAITASAALIESTPSTTTQTTTPTTTQTTTPTTIQTTTHITTATRIRTTTPTTTETTTHTTNPTTTDTTTQTTTPTTTETTTQTTTPTTTRTTTPTTTETTTRTTTPTTTDATTQTTTPTTTRTTTSTTTDTTTPTTIETSTGETNTTTSTSTSTSTTSTTPAPVVCLPGSYLVGDTCQPCPSGQYQNRSGQIECLKCPPGHYQSQSNQTSCDQCTTGTYQSAEGMTSCNPCIAGMFQPQLGRSSCFPCESGTFQPYQGQSACKDCPAGSFQNDTGQSECSLCAPGEFQGFTQRVNCSLCLPGHFQPANGSPNCTVCPSGEYQPEEGMADCLLAPAGFYQPDPGALTFHSCLHGQYQEYTGQPNCDVCLEGLNTTDTNSTSVTQCRTPCDISFGTCLNGGKCTGPYNTSMGPECQCPSGLTGQRCEEDIDECLNPPCSNKGKCDNLFGSYECNCVEVKGITYAGQHCEQKVTSRPVVTMVTPSFGPLSGGTEINITGYNLDLLPPVRLEMDNRYRCDYIGNADKHTFLTPSGNSTDEDVSLPIVVVFLGGLRVKTDYTFQYKGNPNITDFEPQSTLLEGGTTVTVTGDSLDAVANPKVEVTVKISRKWIINAHRIQYNITETRFQGRCVRGANASANIMCLTPDMTTGVPVDIRNATESNPNGTVDYSTDDVEVGFFIGFKLDGVADFKNISNSSNPALAAKGLLKITPLPVVIRNPETPVDYDPEVPYILYGDSLSGVDVADYRVEVGDGTCSITDLAQSSLTCSLPPPTPGRRPDSGDEGDVREVWLFIGTNVMLTNMGFIKYPPSWPPLVGASLGAVAMASIAIVTAVCVIRQRRRLRRTAYGRDDSELISLPPLPAEEQRVSPGAGPWLNRRDSVQYKLPRVMDTKGGGFGVGPRLQGGWEAAGYRPRYTNEEEMLPQWPAEDTATGTQTSTTHGARLMYWQRQSHLGQDVSPEDWYKNRPHPLTQEADADYLTTDESVQGTIDSYDGGDLFTPAVDPEANNRNHRTAENDTEHFDPFESNPNTNKFYMNTAYSRDRSRDADTRDPHDARTYSSKKSHVDVRQTRNARPRSIDAPRAQAVSKSGEVSSGGVRSNGAGRVLNPPMDPRGMPPGPPDHVQDINDLYMKNWRTREAIEDVRADSRRCDLSPADRSQGTSRKMSPRALAWRGHEQTPFDMPLRAQRETYTPDHRAGKRRKRDVLSLYPED